MFCAKKEIISWIQIYDNDIFIDQTMKKILNSQNQIFTITIGCKLNFLTKGNKYHYELILDRELHDLILQLMIYISSKCNVSIILNGMYEKKIHLTSDSKIPHNIGTFICSLGNLSKIGNNYQTNLKILEWKKYSTFASTNSLFN